MSYAKESGISAPAALKGILCGITISGRAVVSDFLNGYPNIFEYLIQRLAIMSEGNGPMMWIIALYEHMACLLYTSDAADE